MADFGIRVSEEDFDVKTTPTDSNKKNFVYLSSDNSPKVIYAGFITGTGFPASGSFTHNLGYVPLFFLFATDSTTSPTYFKSADILASATTTTIYTNLETYTYLVILQEGN